MYTCMPYVDVAWTQDAIKQCKINSEIIDITLERHSFDVRMFMSIRHIVGFFKAANAIKHGAVGKYDGG